MLIGGLFSTVRDVTRNYIARLSPDGSLDTTLDLYVDSGMIRSIALQADGKILIGGLFSLGGGWNKNIFRLNPDGTPDANFDPNNNPLLITIMRFSPSSLRPMERYLSAERSIA